MHAHLEALRAALVAEAAVEREALEAARRLGWSQQVLAGVAWPALSVGEPEPAGRGRWRWTLRAKVALHEGIGPGDAVDLGPSGGGQLGAGRVEAVDGRAAVVVTDLAELPAAVRVTARFDPGGNRRQLEALHAGSGSGAPLARALRGELAWPLGDEVDTPGAGLDLDAASRRLIEAAVVGLHLAQRRAVGAALAAPALAVIHGPPGTGKTRTLVALLRALVATGERPLALADSNAAVDHLAERASAAGLRVVRLGVYARASAAGQALTVERALAQHRVAPAIAAIDRELGRLAGPRAGIERRRLLGERAALEDEARREILDRAEVLAVTLGSLARLGPELPKTRTAVVDEATQATEPATWVAARYVERLILAGDPHQLGPVVKLPNSPLQDSLIHRLLARPPAGAAVVMLEQQHRMHASLHALVQGVYGPSYVPHPSVAAADLRARYPDAEGWEAEPVRWIDTAGAGCEDARDPASGSRYNRGELSLVAGVVAGWRALGVPAAEIGVITPYVAQVERLRALPALAEVEVGTVNAFQGREKDAIVVSFVRSNDDLELGFVADARRLVVAVTRARRAFVGVGDSATLCSFGPLRALIDAAAPGLRSAFEIDTFDVDAV